MTTGGGAAYPGVHVKLQQESDQGSKDTIKRLVAAQSLPDVYLSWAGNHAEQLDDDGVALDLTSQVGAGTRGPRPRLRGRQTFSGVILPLSTPIAVSAVILQVLFARNELLLALIFLSDDSLKTLPGGLSRRRPGPRPTSRPCSRA